jgi:PAS domain S-box-containing protein
MTVDLTGRSLFTHPVLPVHADLQNLIDFIPALVARIDCNMTVVYSNKQFRKWFSGDDVSCSSFPLIVGKKIFHEVQLHLGKVLVGQHAEFTISHFHEGSFRYLDVIISPELDSNRSVQYFIFHATDVTEKRNVQRDLQDYFENGTIGLHWVDAQGVIVWANRAELQMLGYSEDEYVGQHISRFHKNQSCIEDILLRLSNKETLRHHEAELVCKDGSTRHVAINSSVLWEGEKFVHTRCFTIDVTEQKLAANALMDSEARFRTMADLVPLIIWTTNEKGICTFVNAKWVEWTGLEFDPGPGMQWLDGVHSEDRQKIEMSWRKSLAEHNVFEAKLRMRAADGGYVISDVNSVPRFDLAGNFIGHIGIMRDVTSEEQIKSSLERMVLHRVEDLKRKNLELQNAEKALKAKNQELEIINNELSAFAHVASHDLQEPLRKIQTFADRVIQSESGNLSPKGQEALGRIQQASGKMRAFIQDILSYSKINVVGESAELTDLNELLNDVVGEFEISIEETGAAIENRGLPSLPVVRFQFHQLFLNLISNALKFSQPGRVPHVVFQSRLVTGESVTGESTDQFYDITVSDNGCGFEEKYAEKIFEIFNRLQDIAHVEGTGIGLAVCKKIVEGHGGKMVAEGKPLEGATFHIYLPVSK